MEKFIKCLKATLTLVLLLSFMPTLAEADETVTLKFAMWDTELAERELKEIIEPFEEKHPNIKVEMQAMPFAEYWQKVQTSIAGGDPYDVFAMSVAYIWEFAHKGMVMDLTPMYDRIVAESGEGYFYDAVLDCVRYPNAEGQLYELPFAWVDSLLYYNKTVFDEAGIPYPTNEWTYDDLWEAAEKLTSGAGPGKKYGFTNYVSHEFIDSYIKAAGGQVLNDSMTECVVNSEVSVKALEEVYSKVEQGILPAISSMIGQPDLFLSGKAAMSIGGSYLIDTYREIEEFDWDVVLVPSNATTGIRSIYGGPDGVSIASNCAHPEEAMLFVEYYCDKGRTATSYMGGKASIVNKLTQDPLWLESDKKPANKKAIIESGPYIQGADFSYKWSEWRMGIMRNELESAFSGDKTIQEACDRIVEQTNAILSELKK